MKNLIQAALIGALALAASAQAADQQVAIHKAWADNFQDYQREYQLANGETVTLISRRDEMYAALSDGKLHRIAPAERGTFVALDGAFTVHIELGEGEDDAHGWYAAARHDMRLADNKQPFTSGR